MSRNVIIAASLPATPDKLFDMYLDAEAHAAFTGFPVTIAARAGAPFRAFSGWHGAAEHAAELHSDSIRSSSSKGRMASRSCIS